jgi:hypothetical protein
MEQVVKQLEQALSIVREGAMGAMFKLVWNWVPERETILIEPNHTCHIRHMPSHNAQMPHCRMGAPNCIVDPPGDSQSNDQLHDNCSTE